MSKPKIIRACTVPMSLVFVKDLLSDLKEKYEVMLLSSPGSEWEEVRKQHPDVKCIELTMERHISPVKDLKSLWQLWCTFRKEKPQMVHSMTPKAGMLCMVAARLAGVPVRIHTFTGLVFPTAVGLKRKILMATDWLTCACATHIIPEGEGVKNDLLNNGITKKPIKVLGYGSCQGINLERFDRTPDVMAESEKLHEEGVFTFIAVGRLVSDKGINELVEAFVKLNKEHLNLRLILVGPEEEKLDPLKSETIRSIAKYSAIDAVGVKSDVRPWFAASDVAVLASYREGFPNVVIEAGAMGLPSIVTDINGCNEIIIDGQNGVIIPPKNEEALYAAMKHFVDEPSEVERMAANARSLIVSRYDQQMVWDALLKEYQSLCQ